MDHNFVETAAAPGLRSARLAAIVGSGGLACLLVIVAAMSAPSRAYAAIVATVDLGTAGAFAVLGGQRLTNTGTTVLNGNLGVSPGEAITGPLPRLANGATHMGDAVAGDAQSNLTTAYNDAAGRASNFDHTGQDLAGKTLTPGVYTFSTSAQLTGALTLDGQNNPDAVFIFQIGTTLTTASNSSVELTNDANACNVFYQVGRSATLGANTDLAGNILALTSITLSTGATVEGRALARNGSVALDSNIFTNPICATVSQTTPPPTPTSTETEMVTESATPTESAPVTELATPTESTTATELATPVGSASAMESSIGTEWATESKSATESESAVEWTESGADELDSHKGLADSGASGMTPLFLLAAGLSVILGVAMIALTHSAPRPTRRH